MDYIYDNKLVSVTYGHLSDESIKKVEAGQQSKQGDIIGFIAQPDLVHKISVPRLHFEVLSQGLNINSLAWLEDNQKL